MGPNQVKFAVFYIFICPSLYLITRTLYSTNYVTEELTFYTEDLPPARGPNSQCEFAIMRICAKRKRIRFASLRTCLNDFAFASLRNLKKKIAFASLSQRKFRSAREVFHASSVRPPRKVLHAKSSVHLTTAPHSHAYHYTKTRRE